MSNNGRYEDWADWAGDHPEQAEADLQAERLERLAQPMPECEHDEVDTQGVCEDCGTPMPGWEPDDAQLLTQTGTKEPVA